jgi:hypothetical protein
MYAQALMYQHHIKTVIILRYCLDGVLIAMLIFFRLFPNKYRRVVGKKYGLSRCLKVFNILICSSGNIIIGKSSHLGVNLNRRKSISFFRKHMFTSGSTENHSPNPTHHVKIHSRRTNGFSKSIYCRPLLTSSDGRPSGDGTGAVTECSFGKRCIC